MGWEIPTPRGPARAHIDVPGDGATGGGLLVLGHGAGGGVTARDLVAAAGTAMGLGWTVARVEQPYRVAGRRAPAPAPHLDEAWCAVVAALRLAHPAGPLVTGGRSSGARVACRTAAAAGADAVLCLAFPLEPPARGGRPRPSRQDELDAPPVPVLVVQGETDPFGMPADGPRRRVVRLRGDHRLSGDTGGLRAAVAAFLTEVGAAGRPASHARDD